MHGVLKMNRICCFRIERALLFTNLVLSLTRHMTLPPVFTSSDHLMWQDFSWLNNGGIWHSWSRQVICRASRGSSHCTYQKHLVRLVTLISSIYFRMPGQEKFLDSIKVYNELSYRDRLKLTFISYFHWISIALFAVAAESFKYFRMHGSRL